MNSKKLAELRARGFIFDDAYDRVAKIADRFERSQSDTRIKSIQIDREDTDDDLIFFFTVLIELVDPEPGCKVEVRFADKTLIAYQNPLESQNKFFALFSLSFPIPYLHKHYNVTAIVTRVGSNLILDQETKSIEVFSDGHIEDFEEVTSQLPKAKFGSCGIEYRKLTKCTRYKKRYGPVYQGSITMSGFKDWSRLIKEGILTTDERDILIAMSENEGNLDSINGYDSEIISIGSMQKTIKSSGTSGELLDQLVEFKAEFPDKFITLLENCGWAIVERKAAKTGSVYHQIFYDGISGKDLYKLVRKGCDKSSYGQKVSCPPLEPFISLCNDVSFQQKQIIDFIDRLNMCLQKKPMGYANKITDFVKSNLGKAVTLDHDVNRPGQVKTCFAQALDMLIETNSTISKDPSDWGDKHAENENKLLEIYGPLRGKDVGVKKGARFTMTDAKNRYNTLKGKL